MRSAAKLAAIEKERGAQIVVLIVPTARPEDIASFAQRVASNWKLGRKEVGDGLLLTVAKNDRDVNIQVAATLQGAIPDVVAGRIIREQILPAFKAGDFAGGLNSGVDRLSALVAGEKLPAPRAGNVAVPVARPRRLRLAGPGALPLRRRAGPRPDPERRHGQEARRASPPASASARSAGS